MSNLKHFGLGVMMYTQDYDGTYPPIRSDGIGAEPPGGRWLGSTSTTWAWQQLLYPYTKSKQLFVCPSAVGDYANKPFRGNYGANRRLIASPGSSVRLSAVAAPSKTYAMMDAGYYTMLTAYATPSSSSAKAGYGYYLPGIGELGNACDPVSSSYDNLVSDCQSGRHLGGVNMAFADGHVKWLKTSVVSAEAQKPYPNKRGAWAPR